MLLYKKKNHLKFIEALTKSLSDLTAHCYIADQQGKYFAHLKANLQDGECLISMDFAENFAFICHDSVQGFYWNNIQANVHPIVLYFRDSNTIKHMRS